MIGNTILGRFMSTAFGSHIKHLTASFRQAPKPAECIFVMGNEATDLDSTVCSLSLAFVLQSHGGKPLVPFINCTSKAIISMRGELQALLQDLGLTVDDLLFQGEVLEACAAAKGPLEAFLVDHNELATEWKLSHPQLTSSIVGIIDHHADAKLFQEAQPRIVQVCGSNSTLLLEYLDSLKSPEVKARLEDVKSHLLSAIIMDTVNFTWRHTPLDTKWAGRLLAGRDDLTAEQLNEQCKPIMTRFDAGEIPERNFPLRDIIFKDYKLYQKDGTVPFFYGISTLHTSFEQFIAEEFNGSHQALADCIFQVMQEHSLELFCITLAVREAGSSSFYQQLGLFSKSVDISALTAHLQASSTELVETFSGPGYCLGMQNNPNVSRKQLQPYFQQFLLKQ